MILCFGYQEWVGVWNVSYSLAEHHQFWFLRYAWSHPILMEAFNILLGFFYLKAAGKT